MDEKLNFLPKVLPDWYRANRRDLPWRRDRNPYHVWLSEIMLQQTRVEAVRGYYARFLEALPTVRDLARCDDEKLHKLWEGLGYYTRVRNLKKAAIVITEDYGGEFPRTYPEVLALPGIGEYTAGAICSIALGLPRAAVDGNVLRVLSRLRRDSDPIDDPKVKKSIRLELEEIYPADDPGTFTQALMELGATVCLPNGAPRCESCPCRGFCDGQAEWKNFPVKLPKRARKQENRTVFLLECDGRYAIEKRPDSGLLAGLWQFPNCSGHLSPEEAVAFCEQAGLHPRQLRFQVDRPHIFTHIRWDMRCYLLEVGTRIPGFTWMTLDQIDREAALPTAFRQFREELRNV